MILLPAIDIKDGNCVRLLKGDYGTVEKVAEDPLRRQKDSAQPVQNICIWLIWTAQRTAKRVNRALFLEMAKKTDLKIELGGGIRTMEAVDDYLTNGIERVILGFGRSEGPQIRA